MMTRSVSNASLRLWRRPRPGRNASWSAVRTHTVGRRELRPPGSRRNAPMSRLTHTPIGSDGLDVAAFALGGNVWSSPG